MNNPEIPQLSEVQPQPYEGMGLVLNKVDQNDITISIFDKGVVIGATKLPINLLMQAQMALLSGNAVTIQVPQVEQSENVLNS